MNFSIIGYGRLGKRVETALLQQGENIVSIIDPPQGYPFKENSLAGVNVAICFTSPEAGRDTTRAVLSAGVDAVIGTTDFYLLEDKSVNTKMMEEFQQLALSNNSRMVYAPNFAIGMFKFQKIVERAARELLSIYYDPAIIELHHKKKEDISGTAKKIGRSIQESSNGLKTSLNTHDFERRQEQDEITIGVGRAGYIPGTHTIVFDSLSDTIELTHRVRDPYIFANGAIDVAHLLQKRPPGVYSLENILEE